MLNDHDNKPNFRESRREALLWWKILQADLDYRMSGSSRLIGYKDKHLRIATGALIQNIVPVYFGFFQNQTVPSQFCHTSNFPVIREMYP